MKHKLSSLENLTKTLFVKFLKICSSLRRFLLKLEIRPFAVGVSTTAHSRLIAFDAKNVSLL